MIISLLKRTLYVLVLLLLQVLVCNHVHLFGYATPMIYVLFFCYLPQNAHRVGNLLWAFLLGFLIDLFTGTPGQASGALVITAMVQWPLLRAMAPKESLEDMIPSYRTLGKWRHTGYLLILTFVHHCVFYLLEATSYFHLTDLLLSIVASFALSAVIVLSVESMHDRRSLNKT